MNDDVLGELWYGYLERSILQVRLNIFQLGRYGDAARDLSPDLDEFSILESDGKAILRAVGADLLLEHY